MARSGPSRRDFLAAAYLTRAAFAATGAPVIDSHAHLTHHARASWRDDDRLVIEAADKLGIDQMCCSILTPARPSTPEMFSACNQWVFDAIKRFDKRVLGYCYVNPGYSREAVQEVRRCVLDRGFMGIKLYNEYLANEAAVFAVVETAIELRVPILQHAGHGHPGVFRDSQPRISDGGHIAELARRYPEATLICAHIGGGGDWEWTVKALRNARNVFLDTSGSVTDDGMIEFAVRTLGAERLLFACDSSMTAGVGKMRAAELSDADKRKILGLNMQAILRRRNPVA